jgi:hypothetical protein
VVSNRFGAAQVATIANTRAKIEEFEFFAQALLDDEVPFSVTLNAGLDETVPIMPLNNVAIWSGAQAPLKSTLANVWKNIQQRAEAAR